MLTVAGFLILIAAAVAAATLTSGSVRAMGADSRLVVYGSLAPGEANHHIVEGLKGRWFPCVITGSIEMHDGHRVFRWDEKGSRIDAQLLSSPKLPGAWPEIDEFEGAGYRRRVIPVEVGGKRLLANVYTDARNLRTGSEIRS
ncbi:MAG: gamma-glutamylcyclotransferase family protein [Thermoanaerobaculia bacterium]